ncbi:FGGY-family carbohydrate kinase [Kurthia sibirica]|nr:FGGY-family carbohydrate kinase [Kurthia sibirica]
MTNYVLGVDVGTQSLKVAAYTIQGQLVYQTSEAYSTWHNSSGHSEQDPNDWWQALQRSLQRVTDTIDKACIKGMSLAATSSTVLLTDKDLKPIDKAHCWMDQRSAKEEDDINKNLLKIVRDRLRYSGEKTSIEWMLTKSLWFKKNYDLTDKRIVEQLDWLNYKLTSRLVGSQCNATCKWSYVKRLGGFSEDFLDEIGLAGITKHWPHTIIPVGEQVGLITSETAISLNLPINMPVFQGGIDAHIGMIGAGALETGKLKMTTGTSFVHLIHHDQPIFNNALWGPYDEPLVENLWLLEGGQLSCGSIISWFLQEFYPAECDKSAIYAELEREIKLISPGSDGLLILDSWKGNRTPYKTPYATGAMIGLTLSHTKYHIYRAILETIAFGTKNIIRTFEASGVEVHEIIAGGGGTVNESWMQIISNVTGLPITIPKDAEIGTKGASIIAIYGLGYFDSLIDASNNMVKNEKTFYPNMTQKRQYDVLFDNYLELNHVLFPIMEKMKKGGQRSEQYS